MNERHPARTGAARPSPSTGSVTAVMVALRTAVLVGELHPGAQVRQEEWAVRLGVSRVPVREALARLEAEGVVTNRRHRGFFVVRLDRDSAGQLYLMRRVLEAELLHTVEWPGAAALDELRGLRVVLHRAIRDRDVSGWMEADRRFFATVFDLSPLPLVRDEVERLWSMSDAYRGLLATHLLLGSPDRSEPSPYDQVIDALESHDRNSLEKTISGMRRQVASFFDAVLPPQSLLAPASARTSRGRPPE